MSVGRGAADLLFSQNASKASAFGWNGIGRDSVATAMKWCSERRDRVTDNFKGDNAKLVECINALLELDASGNLAPHGIGGSARSLLEASSSRIAALAQQAGAMEAFGLVAAANRLDKFALVILSAVNIEDPQFTDRVGAALADLRNAAHAEPDAIKYRKALEKIFECGMRPEGHPDAGDHEFCGSHHADCIAIARAALASSAPGGGGEVS